MLNKILSGVSAGLLISIGGTVFLSCGDKTVGSVLFSVALLCICYKGYSLYTGRIGYALRDMSKEYLSGLLLGFAGNIAGTAIGGAAIRCALPSLVEKAQTMCAAKLGQAFPQTLIRAIFCGILMYLAVTIFADKKTPIAILFCIPAFILSGFEHCVADIFYFALCGLPRYHSILSVAVFIAVAVLGNTVGALILPLLNPKERIKK